jgi:hypothetical protein
VLAHGLPSNNLSIGRQTLAVIGATFRNSKSGFYLLANDARASQRDTPKHCLMINVPTEQGVSLPPLV